MNYNEMVKSDLVDLAIARGLVVSKNSARSIQKGDLIDMFVQDDKDQEEADAYALVDAHVGQDPEIGGGAFGMVATRSGAKKIVVGVDHGTPDGDHTAVVVASHDKDGVITVLGSQVLPAKPQAPKRYPHGAKSLGEVREIEKLKKWRNQRRHKRSFSPWPGGQLRAGEVSPGFKWRRNIIHLGDPKKFG